MSLRIGLAGAAMLLAVLPAAGALPWQQAAPKQPDAEGASGPGGTSGLAGSGLAGSGLTGSGLTESGRVTIAGRAMPYLIHRLPVSSFPELPAAIAAVLNRRGCMIPQTYEAHHPENVIHGSLERPGSSDWAVLCAAKGTVSLLVFFDRQGMSAAGEQAQPMELIAVPETERLQAHDSSGVLGFDWAIDAASPGQVHAAREGLEPRPTRLDHDALVDTIVEQRRIYRFYEKNAWMSFGSGSPQG
jgi:hypothetical protein